jgi:hypothetical protein
MMSTKTENFELPGKIDRYLATLNQLYKKRDESMLQKIIVNSVISIDEEREYDNWNGGTYGHGLTLTISEDLFLDLVDDRDELQKRICTDINGLDNTPNEYVSIVSIEMETSATGRWRENSGVLHPRVAASSVPADSLARIWGNGHVHVFLSHKAKCKKDTSKLKQALARYGISCFVAHEDIEATEEWQRELEHALNSMDALVALLTEDFHDSEWTDQEVGVAIGRDVVLIPVRLGCDPYGLMGKVQGLSGCDWANIDGMAASVFDLLHKRLPDKSRFLEAVLSAYAASDSYDESAWIVKNILTKFETLTRHQVAQVMDAYRNNRQNIRSWAGRDRLRTLMEKWTGKDWNVTTDGDLAVVEVKSPEEDIPF